MTNRVWLCRIILDSEILVRTPKFPLDIECRFALLAFSPVSVKTGNSDEMQDISLMHSNMV